MLIYIYVIIFQYLQVSISPQVNNSYICVLGKMFWMFYISVLNLLSSIVIIEKYL